jgi:hypothetical protein
MRAGGPMAPTAIITQALGFWVLVTAASGLWMQHGTARLNHLLQGKATEGKEYDAVRRFVDGRSEGFKVGDALLILDHDLAIDQGRFAGELAGSLDHPAIWSGPISAGA